MENLQQIRELALETQEKLIVPEETVSQGTQSPKPQEVELQGTLLSRQSEIDAQESQQQAAKPHEMAQSQQPVLEHGAQLFHQQVEEPEGSLRLGQHTVVQATTPSDPWEMLREILTPVEVSALRVIESKQSLTAFALEQGIMGEVLIEGINEKAMDCIGDTLLEMDEEVMIYEDYLPFLGKITRR